MTTGEIIRDLRKQKGISQQELADKLNVTQSMLSQYERGIRSPKMSTLKKIAMALDVSADELIVLSANNSDDKLPGVFTSWKKSLFSRQIMNELDDITSYYKYRYDGRQIDFALMEYRMSSKTLAEKVGVSEAEIEMYLHGACPITIQVLEKIAAVFDRDVNHYIKKPKFAGSDDGLPRSPNDGKSISISDCTNLIAGRVDLPDELDHFEMFRELNDEGKRKAKEYLADLVEQKKYRKGNK